MVLILIGVAGSGKTTVGKLLAKRLGWSFFDADDFHPKSNIEKMSRGISLTDEDRWPWLLSIRDFIDERDEEMVFACSALKKSYRDFLRQSAKHLEFIYLKGSKEVILHRLEDRKGHFAGSDLLESQLRDLEEPQNVPVEDITQNPEAIVSD
ncbi:MAG: gluconokinase, partial [Pirellulales bacterium]|nr:gluconokinase [Pirellulales bacterium]